jgi:hypothetical protein
MGFVLSYSRIGLAKNILVYSIRASERDPVTAILTGLNNKI